MSVFGYVHQCILVSMVALQGERDGSRSTSTSSGEPATTWTINVSYSLSTRWWRRYGGLDMFNTKEFNATMATFQVIDCLVLY